jgi:peroxiredoxin
MTKQYYSILFSLVVFLSVGQAQQLNHRPVGAEEVMVPQTLLSLLHAHEVQTAIGLQGNKLQQFLPRLQQIDGPWWQARIRPAKEQRQITAKQEQLAMTELTRLLEPKSITRLRQIELQSQGYRCLLRPEVVEHLRLTSDQIASLKGTFAKTDTLAEKAQKAQGEEGKRLQEELQAAKQAEFSAGPKVLTSEQQVKLREAIGEVFDTAKLDRIYPLAPELLDSGQWVGEKVSLQSQRGKVVLVHFYAFQCSNCIANFKIYNRWEEKLAPKGVRLIGIQTPETSAERDPSRVREAAKKDKFRFPVVIDVDSTNWKAWGNTMWPTVYVIDKRGYIRFWWQGELNWQGATVDQTIEKIVDRLLAES